MGHDYCHRHECVCYRGCPDCNPRSEEKSAPTPPAEPVTVGEREAVKKGWRVFENVFRGEWGIEDLADPDGDAILPPKRIDREHLDRIVAAYNAALSVSPSPADSRDALIERLVKALRYMLAETDPYREGRGTDAEIAARRDAVAALNAFDSAALAAQEQP